MAELDDKLLKNLNKTLESMNERLLTLETTLSGVKNGLNKTFDPSIITSFSDAIRGLKTLRLIDAEGATKDIQKVKDKIDELEAKWKGDKPLGKGESFAGIADELARYKALMKDIQKGSEQRAVELANAAKKEADAVEAEERRKQREFQATANEQAKLLKAYSDIERARSVVTGGKKFGELDAEQTKKYKEFGRTLEDLKKKMDDLEKASPGSKAAGTQIFKEQEAITKAKREAAEEQTRIKKEQAEQERQINEAIKEEERRRAAENKRMLDEEKKALAEYIRLFSEKQSILKNVAPLDAKVIRNQPLTEQERGLHDASWNRIYAIQDQMAKLRESYVSVLEYEEKIQANGQEQVALGKVRLTQEQSLAKEKERQAKSESKQQSDEAKIQRQADAIVKKRIDIERQVQRIDNDRAVRQQTNSKISQQALDAESRKYEALLQRIDQLDKALAKLEGKQAGVTARAEQRNAPYMNYVAAAEEERKAKAIENSTKKLKEQKNTLDSMLPTLQRLASAFGIAFSVRGLAQFGKKLIETRGEFEMQFVAMKQIIGDVDAATKIWNQTMQQALQSPKTFKELVTYTKQLAAYRIETEKLFDTTKRLADVSAGLGVEMSRLILAYGQVKSANFLRASEVRQFTEAGVNIVGNLAKYFTELEGRAVGTAEVMERITKRMVLFSDVEAIFKRMTDEGGEFYNMQEVQADTVKGQIQKLHDAYDQMLNTIGQANQGTIRNFVDTLNNLVRNWQNVAFVLKANINWITIFGASLYALSNKYMKGATTQTLWFSKALTGNEKVLLKEAGAVRLFGNEVGLLSVKQRIGVIAMRSFQGAIMAVGRALSTLWPLLVFEGITLLVERLTRASRELKRFREELQEVASTNVGQMDEEINGYDTLIKKLKQTTDGTMARKEVLDEISRRYGKYIDFIITEKTTVEELAGAYDKVVSSIRNYTAEKIREEQQQRLEKGLYDEYQDLINNLTGASVQFEGGWVNLSKSQAKNIAKLVEKSLKETGAVDLQSILGKYLGLDFDDASYERINYYVEGIVNSYVNAYKGLKGELQEIRDDIEGQTPVFASESEYEQYKKNVDDANKEIAAQNDLYQQQVDLVKQKTEEQWKIDDEIAKLRLENEEEILRIRKEYGLISEGQYNDELARLHGRLDSYETDYNKRLAKALAESYGESWQTEKKEARDMYNYVVSTEQALAQGTTQRNKQLKESYKGFKDSLEQYNAQYQAAVNSGASKKALEKIQADIDLAKLMMAAIELAANLRGIDLSENKKRTRTTHENASKLISLIKEMRSEYDKLSKSAYGYAKSEEKVRDSFKQSYEDILKETGVAANFDFTTNQGEIEALKKVRDYIKGNAKYAKDAWKDVQKTIDQLTAETEIEISVRIREDFGKQMEKAFNEYELTLELDKLNLPKGLAADMWGIEETDLQDLRKKLSQVYIGLRDENGQLSDEAFKDYEKFLNKIDDLERKQQRERLKDYAKYLEAQYSDRAKLEMDYVRRLSQLEAETAIPEQQKSDIRKGLEREFLEKSRKQDWEDFKGSEFYVGMMEDLEKQGSASLEVMRKKLLEMRENAENLSPRALKEVVNALEKIDELEKKRIPPLKRIREEQEKLKGIEIKDVYERIAANQEKLAQDEQEQKDLERMIMLEEERQKLEKQGVTLDRAKTNLSMFEGYRVVAEGNLRRFKSDGSKESQAQLSALKEDLNQWSMLAEKWAEIVRILSGQATIDKQEGGSKYKGLSLPELKKRRDDAKQRIKDLEGVIGKDEELVKAQKDLEDAWDDTWEEAKRWAQSINGIFDGVMDSIGYFSDSTSTLTAEWKEFGDASISALTDLVSGIQAYQQANAAAQKAGAATGLFTANGLQLAMVILGVIIKIVQAIAKMHDARIDKEIEQSKKKVDDLQKAYDRLEKSIEKTFDTVSYIREYNQEVQNLNEQIEEANNQIAAAQDYKSEDKKREAIEAAEDAKQEALDALDEIKQKQIEVFGGIGEDNYRSAAEGFVDAWKSAFLETGDGLQGLQDHFDEFLNDWFVKQATMRIAASNLEPLFRKIDDAVDQYGLGGTDVIPQELQEINDLKDLLLTRTNEQLKELAGVFGLGGEGSLSGLAAGIQGMTEEQANILESYWNSVRGYTASIDLNVARIADILGAGGRSTNPQIQYLESIASNTMAIREMLSSALTNEGNGRGFRSYAL